MEIIRIIIIEIAEPTLPRPLGHHV